MSHTQVHAVRRPGGRSWSLAPLVAAAAVGCCVSACGGSGAAAKSPGASASPSQAADPGSQAADQGSQPAGPGAVLADWLRQVAANDRRAACQEMREPGLSAEKSVATCMSAAGASLFNSLHSNFATDGITSGTQISVDAGQAKGTSVTVSGSHIRVSGTTLDSLMTTHSTGVKPGQLDISFKLSHIDGAWYVTDMNLNV